MGTAPVDDNARPQCLESIPVVGRIFRHWLSSPLSFGDSLFEYLWIFVASKDIQGILKLLRLYQIFVLLNAALILILKAGLPSLVTEGRRGKPRGAIPGSSGDQNA
jgi:hypothetical protein